jgi:prepilin-type processing-associated H-X9-DG protein
MVEVLVTIVIVAILFLVVFPVLLTRFNIGSKKSTCVNNLKINGLAVRMWAPNSIDEAPWHCRTNDGGTVEFIGKGELFRHFAALSNELGRSTKSLVCPEGKRRPASSFTILSNQNIGYFLGVDGQAGHPWMILSGDINLTNLIPWGNRLFIFGANPAVKWEKGPHPHGGNISLADGSVRECPGTSLLKIIERAPENLTNRLEMP